MNTTPPCSGCNDFGQVDDTTKPVCFGCDYFNASAFARMILNAVNNDDFEVDENMLIDFNKYVNKKFTPTIKKQAVTPMDKVAIWLVSKLGTMTFFWLCFAMVTLPLVYPNSMPVVQYVSSGYLQLLFLPLIMIAGNLQQRRAELREESSYKISVKQDIQIEWLNYKIDRLKSQIKGLEK